MALLGAIMWQGAISPEPASAQMPVSDATASPDERVERSTRQAGSLVEDGSVERSTRRAAPLIDGIVERSVVRAPMFNEEDVERSTTVAPIADAAVVKQAEHMAEPE